MAEGSSVTSDGAGNTSTEKNDQELLKRSLHGATSLVLLQVGTRALTFLVNQIVLRHISPEYLAIATQLELYLITTLYFARESLRVALQRQTDSEVQVSHVRQTLGHDETEDETDDGGRAGRRASRQELKRGNDTAENKNESIGGRIVPEELRGAMDDGSPAAKTQVVVNLSYLSLLVGVPLAIGLGTLYLRSSVSAVPSVSSKTAPKSDYIPWLREALIMYGIASVAELLTEPCFAVTQQKLLYKLRASAESAATMARCFVTCAVTILGAQRQQESDMPSLGVLPFAVGQLAYAAVLVAVYYRKTFAVAKEGGFSLFPRQISVTRQGSKGGYDDRANHEYMFHYFSRPLLSLSGTIFVQSAVKHILTQGDSLLIAALATLADQGAYALASNYGGLVARIVFQPVEESCRNLFAKMLSAHDDKEQGPVAVAAATDVHAAQKILYDILRLYLLLAIVACAVGPAAAPLLLRLVAGARWQAAGAGAALAAYCYYVPLLALNGVAEAFVAAVATPAQLRRQAGWMLAFSAGFAGAGYLFLARLGWGAAGIVWANGVNMLLRVAWSASFIAAYFGRRYRARRGGAGRGRERGAEGSLSGPVPVGAILPRPATCAVGVGAGAILLRSQLVAEGGVRALAAVGAVGVVTVALMIFFERHFLLGLYTSRKST